jgi:hypothetical protein
MPPPDNFDVLQHGRLVVLRWRRPTVEASDRALAELRRCRAEAGEPLVLVLLAGPDCEVPDGATRDRVISNQKLAYELLESATAVMFGTGPRMAVRRSVFTTITLVAGMRGTPIRSARSISGAVEAAAKKLGRPVEPVVRQLVARGVVTTEELGA